MPLFIVKDIGFCWRRLISTGQRYKGDAATTYAESGAICRRSSGTLLAKLPQNLSDICYSLHKAGFIGAFVNRVVAIPKWPKAV